MMIYNATNVNHMWLNDTRKSDVLMIYLSILFGGVLILIVVNNIEEWSIGKPQWALMNLALQLLLSGRQGGLRSDPKVPNALSRNVGNL